MEQQYTRLNEAEIKLVAVKFGFDAISDFKLLSGGSENTNYLIHTSKGKYVVSICEQKTVKEATALANLLAHLEAHHFSTSKIIYSSKGKPIILWKDQPVMVKQFIEGKIKRNLSAHLLQFIGGELAKLHQIKAPEYLTTKLGYGKEQFGNVKKYAANSAFDNWLEKIEQYIEPLFSLALPTVLIHSDLFWDNVIISEDENAATIMDFEEAACYYRIYDIGMAIIGLCAEEKTINFQKAKHLLKGYQKETKLLDREIKALKAFTIYAGASMTFWRHQNFIYLKPDPAKFDCYLGLKILTDFIVAQDDDCFSRLFNKY